MANAGGVGGSGNKGGSVGNTKSVDSGSKSISKAGSIGKTGAQNTTAKINNKDGVNAQKGIDREAKQKSDLNSKLDSAKANSKVDTANADKAKNQKTKADKAAAAKKQEITSQLFNKAKGFAKTAKKEFDKFVQNVKKEVALSNKRKELEQMLKEPKVKAMLDTIAKTEGTGLNYGKVVNGTVIGQNAKNTSFDKSLTKGLKNVSTTDFSKHPNISVKVRDGLVSSAAGRYQFKSDTWKETAAKIGLKDFTPHSQDLAAVQKMNALGMVKSLMSGDLQKAVNQGAGTWASLPKDDGKGNYPGQKAKNFNDIQSAYNGYVKDAEAMTNVGDYN
jgi:muramidase (phage lysozyme)